MPSFLDQIFMTSIKRATTVVLVRNELKSATGNIVRRIARETVLGEPIMCLTTQFSTPV